MKIFLILGLALISAPSFAETFKGTCQLESSKQSIVLKSYDPTMHYGMFAEGFSKFNDRIYLTTNYQGAVDVNIQSTNGGAYSIAPYNAQGVAVIKTGAYLKGDRNRPEEWLSCDLIVSKR